MDTTQQTINEIRGTYTDLIDRMHEEVAVYADEPAEKRLKTQHPGPSA